MVQHLRPVSGRNAAFDAELIHRADSWVEQHREELVQDIFTTVRIPSVSVPTEGKYPHGIECARVLDAMAELTGKAGFPMENHGYHFGTATLKGTGEGTIGIFGHLDVVPVADDWSFPPFEPFLKDGYLYGRGTTDDKGAAVAGLYVLRCLKDLNIPLKHSVMLYTGCDEEMGMGDIGCYLAECTPPELTLVPDSRFSVCCGEKGMVSAKITFPLAHTGVLELEGGSAENIVPSSARAVIVCSQEEAQAIAAREGLTVSYDGSKATVTAAGIASHAAFPENSLNAIGVLTSGLKAVPFADGGTAAVISAVEAMSRGYLGKGVGIDAEDDFFGPLTAVAGTARTESGMLTVSLNVRYPVATSGEKIRQQLEAFCAANGGSLTHFFDDGPAYFAPDHPVPVLLNDLCREVLQAEFAPYSMGGGTYARHLPNAMACGPLNRHLARPGGTSRGGGHQPDECVCLESLENLIKIYVRAIVGIDSMI